eukprot:5018068-Prymnesium_polylepis.1
MDLRSSGRSGPPKTSASTNCSPAARRGGPAVLREGAAALAGRVCQRGSAAGREALLVRDGIGPGKPRAEHG